MFKNSYFSSIWFSSKAVLATVLTFFGAQIIAGIWITILLVVLGNDTSEIGNLLTDNLTYGLIYSGLVAGISIASVWLLLRYFQKKPRAFLGLQGQKFGKNVVYKTLLVYGLYFLSLIVVMSLVDAATPVNVNQEQELGISAPRNMIEYFQIYLMLAVIPPIFEEILFRGFLYKTLRKRVNIVVAGIITSVLFGVAHLEYDNLNWVAAIDTMVFSGFLIYLVEKQKSLYGAILLHAIKNTIAFLVLFVYS